MRHSWLATLGWKQHQITDFGWRFLGICCHRGSRHWGIYEGGIKLKTLSILCHTRLAIIGRLHYRILDGDSLGICWGRFTGALFFMILNDFLISILICICTCDAYEIRIKGFRDCLDLYGVILLTKMKKKLRFPERK